MGQPWMALIGWEQPLQPRQTQASGSKEAKLPDSHKQVHAASSARQISKFPEEENLRIRQQHSRSQIMFIQHSGVGSTRQIACIPYGVPTYGALSLRELRWRRKEHSTLRSTPHRHPSTPLLKTTPNTAKRTGRKMLRMIPDTPDTAIQRHRRSNGNSRFARTLGSCRT